jgi:cell volume regulation protein A
LKGAVPIVLATFPLTAGVPGASLIFDVVFFVVLVSVLAQGISLVPLVNRLGFEREQPAWSPIAEAYPIEGIEVDVIEVMVTSELPLVGRRLAEVDTPDDALITTIIRGQQVVIPTGSTTIEIDDVLLITARRERDAVQRLTAWARGEAGPGR